MLKMISRIYWLARGEWHRRCAAAAAAVRDVARESDHRLAYCCARQHRRLAGGAR